MALSGAQQIPCTACFRLYRSLGVRTVAREDGCVSRRTGRPRARGRMPAVDGLEATRRIMAGGDAPPRVLILTTFDLDEYVYDALRAGASGFLLKDVPPEQLAPPSASSPRATRCSLRRSPAGSSRLRRRRRRPARPRRARRADRRASSRSSASSPAASRTPRSPTNSSSARTVKTHVTRILSKLGLRDRVQAVVLAYETGMIRPGGEPELQQ